MRKEWTKPKLISLYRGRPEEAVLLGCKLDGAASGPRDIDGELGGGVDCDVGPINDCQLIGQS